MNINTNYYQISGYSFNKYGKTQHNQSGNYNSPTLHRQNVATFCGYDDTFERKGKDNRTHTTKPYELTRPLNTYTGNITSSKSVDWERDIYTERNGFSNIAGYNKVKALLQRDFVDKVNNEKIGKYSSEPIPNSILFYGPTGCGKNELVNALATESDCVIENIQCYGSNKAQKLIKTLIGNSDRNKNNEEFGVSGLLDKAQQRFLKTGQRTIIFIDHFDRFFVKDTSNEFIKSMKNILESCSENNHVTFCFATNSPQKIPYTLRNPQKNMNTYPIGLPKESDAKAIIKYYLQNTETESLDYNAILNELFKYAPNELYSGSHLKRICEIAKGITPKNSLLTTEKFMEALEQYNNTGIDTRVLRVTKEYLDQYEQDKATI